MAKNTRNRISVKWIRDKAKSAYQKKDHCFVCGSESDLELHHTHSITLLLQRWIEKTGRDFSSDESTVENRDEFIEHHRKEIYQDVYTLCNPHHVLLHSVFGKAPGLHTTEKQRNWLEIQKSKKTGVVTIKSELMTFSSLYCGFEGFKTLYERKQ